MDRLTPQVVQQSPWNQKQVWRYFVRSKDRITGSPNNFTVALTNPIPDNVDDFWVQLQTVYCHAYPSPSDATSVKSQSASTGLFNQPGTTTVNYGFDTGGAVDMVVNFQPINTLDSETAAQVAYTTSGSITGASGTTMTIPIDNKVGIYIGDTLSLAGFTGTVSAFTATGLTITFGSTQTWTTLASGTSVLLSPASPLKTRSDKTFALIPYSRGENERTLRLWTTQPWVKVNPTNFGYVQVKLFNDRGFPLRLRKFTSAAVGDANDIAVDDWAFELLITTTAQLPNGAASHKI